MGIKSFLQRLTNGFDAFDEELSQAQMDIDKDIEKGNIFVESVDSLSADDIAPPPPPVPSQNGAGEWIRRAVIIVFACVFVASVGWLITKFVHYQRANEIYGELADIIFSSDISGERAVTLCPPAIKMSPMADYYTILSQNSGTVETEIGARNVRFEQMRSNLIYLKSQNPDIYAYIHIDGTRISFPIVKGKNNEYYLDRAYNNDYMVCGSIFADYSADDNFENNRNTVFYGHNMLDGNMFNNVMLFRDEEVFNSKLIEIYTLDGLYTFEPFAIFQTVYNFPYFRMKFDSDDDFVTFCERMQAKSLHNKKMSFTPEDRIITLSTCTPYDDVESYFVGRFALHAKLIKVER